MVTKTSLQRWQFLSWFSLYKGSKQWMEPSGLIKKKNPCWVILVGRPTSRYQYISKLEGRRNLLRTSSPIQPTHLMLTEGVIQVPAQLNNAWMMNPHWIEEMDTNIDMDLSLLHHDTIPYLQVPSSNWRRQKKVLGLFGQMGSLLVIDDYCWWGRSIRLELQLNCSNLSANSSFNLSEGNGILEVLVWYRAFELVNF